MKKKAARLCTLEDSCLIFHVDFYISQKLLGTSHSLVIKEDGTFCWNSEIVPEYGIGDETAEICIEDISSMMGKNRIDLSIAPQSQVKAFKSLGLDPSQIKWSEALSPEDFYRRVQDITDEVSELLSVYSKTGYDKTFKECKKFLRSLSRGSVDNYKIEKYIRECDSGPSVISSLKSFWGDKETGRASEVKYSQTSTSTGRLVVQDGPSILTLPSKSKDIIVPSRPGTIFQADFVSLEPRVMRYVTGQSAAPDIYEDIRENLFRGQVDRKVVKLATLSALYGSSHRGISKITGNAEASKNVIRRVRDYFNVPRLESSLMNLLIEEKALSNYYGRPLMISDIKPNILVSHFIQSTAVDTALLGFSKLFSNMKSSSIMPIYVIHDAVIVDVPLEETQYFMEACSKGIDLPIGKFNFDVTKISERLQ